MQPGRTRETILGCGIQCIAQHAAPPRRAIKKGTEGTGRGKIQKWISVMKPDYDERCPLRKIHIIFFIPSILGVPSPSRLCYS